MHRSSNDEEAQSTKSIQCHIRTIVSRLPKLIRHISQTIPLSHPILFLNELKIRHQHLIEHDNARSRQARNITFKKRKCNSHPFIRERAHEVNIPRKHRERPIRSWLLLASFPRSPASGLRIPAMVCLRRWYTSLPWVIGLADCIQLLHDRFEIHG